MLGADFFFLDVKKQRERGEIEREQILREGLREKVAGFSGQRD